MEFRLKNIPYSQQEKYSVTYKGTPIGEYIPDLIVFDKIIIETKTVDRITDHERGQMLNYLKITRLSVGLILNFKNPKLEYERLVC